MRRSINWVIQPEQCKLDYIRKLSKKANVADRLISVVTALSDLTVPGTKPLERFKGLNIGSAGFSFGFQVNAVGKPTGATLSDVFTELIDTEDRNNLVFALKAARDADHGLG